ncbi:MAG: lmo0937 family membrane protein [Candidatus Diapherotrites archaeon]|uniref:Lmo0937 family membrane protein n=1 Tax=Candidatus Iainarchaeum sp. TaxID=3101447 RepID=A0A8T4LFQ1_9ARCH|nr:lmo0937 family membrane protein [Candidatus Diapherotrites archaeon]
MIWTIVVILVILWILGLIGSIGGGLIHILLVIAAIIVVYRLAQGRNMLTGK